MGRSSKLSKAGRAGSKPRSRARSFPVTFSRMSRYVSRSLIRQYVLSRSMTGR